MLLMSNISKNSWCQNQLTNWGRSWVGRFAFQWKSVLEWVNKATLVLPNMGMSDFVVIDESGNYIFEELGLRDLYFTNAA